MPFYSATKLSSPALLGHSRSAQLCRFAPVAPHSFLASRSFAQPTDDPMEKLCSALNFCWLKKKKPFSNGKRNYAPGYFLLEEACSSASQDLQVLDLRRRASSRLRAVCGSLLTPCRWPAGSLCWWRLPSIQNVSHCNFRQKSKRSWSWTWKKGQVSFRAWAASKGMFVVLIAYTGSLGCTMWTVGIWNFLTQLIRLEIPTDRPTKVCEKTVRF